MTPNNGPSAGSTRTVCQAPADRPPAAADCPKPCPTKPQSHNETSKPRKLSEQEHEEHGKNSLLADRPPAPRGLSVPHGQNRKQPDLEGQLPQIIIGFPKR
jgi:hypothetical protein